MGLVANPLSGQLVPQLIWNTHRAALSIGYVRAAQELGMGSSLRTTISRRWGDGGLHVAVSQSSFVLLLLFQRPGLIAGGPGLGR